MMISSVKRISLNNLSRLKVISLILTLLGLLFINTPIFASADTKVYDYANLLTLEEIESLETTATELAQTHQLDVGIVTTDDAEGKSAQAYADDFYDYNGYGYGSNYDGLLFLIDMDNREIYISTCGSGISYFTDQRINNMLDDAYDYVSDGDYYNACQSFLKNTDSYIKAGIPSNQFSYEGEFVSSAKHKPFTNSYGEPLTNENILLSVVAALLGGALIAFIVRFIVKRTYTHPRYTTPQTTPDDLSVRYSQKEDHFVTSHTSRVKIETSSSSSGGSSTHRSSSGRSHGGGGRKF